MMSCRRRHSHWTGSSDKTVWLGYERPPDRTQPETLSYVSFFVICAQMPLTSRKYRRRDQQAGGGEMLTMLTKLRPHTVYLLCGCCVTKNNNNELIRGCDRDILRIPRHSGKLWRFLASPSQRSAILTWPRLFPHLTAVTSSAGNQLFTGSNNGGKSSRCGFGALVRAHLTANEASQHPPALVTDENLLTVWTRGEDLHLPFRSLSAKQEVQKKIKRKWRPDSLKTKSRAKSLCMNRRFSFRQIEILKIKICQLFKCLG